MRCILKSYLWVPHALFNLESSFLKQFYTVDSRVKYNTYNMDCEEEIIYASKTKTEYGSKTRKHKIPKSSLKSHTCKEDKRENGEVETVKTKAITAATTPRHMFSRGFLERRDLEQYFWTDKCVSEILNGIKWTFGADESCCLCTPTIAEAWWVEGEEASLLDIDERFKYLPKFRYFDLRYPQQTDLDPERDDWRIIIFDPPFFYISLQVLFNAVEYVCNSQFSKTKLLIGFLKREEKLLLETFKAFNLKRTNFPLEYAHVKPNKWVNYALYSNVDIPGIKRIN